MVPMFAYIALAAFMFCVGASGVVFRRNPIVVFMCIELMLNSVNLVFLTFSKYAPWTIAGGHDKLQPHMGGQMMVIFVMAVAAAEVAVGLGIIMAIFRLRHEIDIDEMNLLSG